MDKHKHEYYISIDKSLLYEKLITFFNLHVKVYASKIIFI